MFKAETTADIFLYSTSTDYLIELNVQYIPNKMYFWTVTVSSAYLQSNKKNLNYTIKLFSKN